MGRVGNYAGLRFADDTADPSRGALMPRSRSGPPPIATRLLFFELEWAEVPTTHASRRCWPTTALDFCATTCAPCAATATTCSPSPRSSPHREVASAAPRRGSRLFDELTSAIERRAARTVAGGGEGDEPSPSGSRRACRCCSTPTATSARRRRRGGHRRPGARAAHPGLRLQHAAARQVDRRPPAQLPDVDLVAEPGQRGHRRVGAGARRRRRRPLRHPAALVRAEGPDARRRPPRRLRPHGLGGRATSRTIGWAEATRASCSTPTASSRPSWPTSPSAFFDEQWIDAPIRPGKRPGAFCAYTVPSHHPYVLLNWTSRARDVATLAHELGHGLHAYLAREQGVFHQSTPLTLAETASVFGETVTSNALLATLDDPAARLRAAGRRRSRTRSPRCSARWR